MAEWPILIFCLVVALVFLVIYGIFLIPLIALSIRDAINYIKSKVRK